MKKLSIFKCLLLCTIFVSNIYANKSHFISMSNEAKYEKDFKHFDYVNAKASKGGSIKLAANGTYDSLNPFILKGISASGIGLIYDSLMSSSADEASTYYALVAQYIEVDKNNHWVKFYINPKAKFHDGVQIKASDVKFSFDILISKGTPLYKRYYADIKNVEVIDNLTVKFNFKNNKNTELALILASLNILPEHFYKNKDFSKASNILPLGSGPYIIDKYEFGKYISYKRDKNYWAKDLAVNKGLYNFNKIKYDYYKDQTVALEAFKAGEYDFRQENTAKSWATMYKGKNFDNNKIIKERRKHENAAGMQAFIFNIRKPLFQDLEVRRAINLAFDYEWTNKQLFYNQYTRSNSYFANSELSSIDLPSKEELLLLNPLKNSIPKSIFNKVFKNPVSNASGKIRQRLRLAIKILKKQGWVNKNRVLVKNNKNFTFEILLTSPAFERVVQPFIKNLKKIGINASMKIIDSVSYTNRVKNFNYDMIVGSFPVSLSPGNELRSFWGSKSTSIIGSRNYIGVKNPAIDTLIKEVVVASSRARLITAVRALDRVLLHNYYVISNWYIPAYRLSYWNKFNHAKIAPKYELGFFTWWLKDEYIKDKN